MFKILSMVKSVLLLNENVFFFFFAILFGVVEVLRIIIT